MAKQIMPPSSEMSSCALPYISLRLASSSSTRASMMSFSNSGFIHLLSFQRRSADFVSAVNLRKRRRQSGGGPSTRRRTAP